MKKGLVSIILPVYNAKKEDLQDTIQSVINQSYNNWELIIINDASTNDIEKTIFHYITLDKRIKYYKNEKNLRLTKTLNKGLSISTGAFIARIDDEDTWNDKEKLEKQISFLEKNREYGICGTNAIAISPENDFLFIAKKPEKDKEIRKLMLSGTQLVHVSVVFRKSCIEDVGCYDPYWNYVEDHELRLRIGKKHKLYNIQENCVTFKIDPNGISGKNRRKQRWNILKLSILYRHFYPDFFLSICKNILHYMLSLLPLKFSLFLIKQKNEKHSPY